MPDGLTGAFDVAVQASIPGVNLVLAAQHQAGRYVSSVRVRVPPRGGDDGTGVQGSGEIQVSTPTISLPAGRGASRVAAHFQLMAYMRPSPGSAEVPEFVHTELRLAANVDRIASPEIGEAVTIDLAAEDLEVALTPDPGAALAPRERSVVDRAVETFIRQGFEPLNQRISFPGEGEFAVRHWRFKTLSDPALPAVALLLNLRDVPPTDAQVSAFDHVFLEEGDDFAIAVGRDFLVSTIQRLISEEIRLWLGGFEITMPTCGRDVRVRLDEPQVELTEGQIVITLTGTVRRRQSWSFSIQQPLTLRIPGRRRLLGRRADDENEIRIIPLAPRVDVSGRGPVRRRRIREAISDLLLDDARVRMLRLAEEKLQNVLASFARFLDDLNVPTLSVTYRSVDIRSDGIVVRGKLDVEWEDVVAVYDQRQVPPDPPARPDLELELSAFRSRIPGGTIRRCRWVYGSDGAVVHDIVEEHRFITRVPVRTLLTSACVWPPCRWCLEVQGTQGRQPSGAPREVVGWYCNVIALGTVAPPGVGMDETRLPTAVVDPSGKVVAHLDLRDLGGPRPGAVAGVRESGAPLLVHFAGPHPEQTISILSQVLADYASETRLIPAVAVLEPGGLPTAFGSMNIPRGLPLAWAEDAEAGWAHTFHVSTRPATLLVDAHGKVVWQEEGPPDAARLHKVLSEHPVDVGALHYRQLRLRVQEDEPAPDFLFEHQKGRQLALRTLRGHPVSLVFWASWSEPSLAQLRGLQERREQAGEPEAIILAVNDGEDPQRAETVFRQHGLSVQFVPDPDRDIARLFDVNCWPTTVSLDDTGLIRHILFGVTPVDGSRAPSER